MKRSKKRIAVIGSGITGLAAAYRIKQQIERENLPFELLVLESAIHSGGSIFTMKLDEHYFDLGVSGIDTREKEGLELIDDLGLTDQMVYSQNGKEDLYMFNQLHHFDFPTYKGLPAKLRDVWKYKNISLHGKLSFMRDAYFPKVSLQQNMAIGPYLRHRLGSEVTEYIAEPYFSRVYMGDVDQVGIKNSKERLFRLAEESGSLIKAIEDHPEIWDADGNYATFEKGLNVLTEKLTEELGDCIQYNQKVTEIQPSIQGTYILDINHKQQVRVGAVCVATGPDSYKSLFTDDKLKGFFNDVQMGSVGYLLFSFPKGTIQREPVGFGILTPKRSDSYIKSITLLNKKWPFYGNEEEYVGVSFGRMGENFLMSLSNKQLEEFVLKELQNILQITEAPLYRVVKRWPDALPRYTVKHEQKYPAIISYMEEEYPGVYFAGNGFDGYGVNQCIRQANKVSLKVLGHVKEQNRA